MVSSPRCQLICGRLAILRVGEHSNGKRATIQILRIFLQLALALFSIFRDFTTDGENAVESGGG
jgi:hypothetical protein